MIKCPHCGASHYSEGPSECTLAYYPPIWKDGINVNPDRNTTTTRAHCCECHYDFVIKECAGEVWTEEGKHNPPKPPIDVNITSMPNAYTSVEYVPMKTGTSLGIAVIDKDGNPLLEKTKEEKDIEEVKDEIQELKKEISEIKHFMKGLMYV